MLKKAEPTLFDTWDPEVAQAAIDKVAAQSGIVLRPYQRESVDAAYQQWSECSSTLINLPTGCGKSVCFAEVMRRWDVKARGRILLIAHRKELIYQAVGHAKRANLDASIEMAGQWANSHADVVVASIATLTNSKTRCLRCMDGCDECTDGKLPRFARFDPQRFGLITIDEGHHAVADQFRKVLTWFRQNDGLKVLFVTATPTRADGIGLNNVCDSVAYEMNLKTAIDEGWLVPIRQKFVTVDGLDISKVKTRQGDLAPGELQTAFLGTDEEEEKMLHAIVKPTLMEANGRKTLVFAAGKEHAKKLSACFEANGVEAPCVIESTDERTRAELVARFRDGDLQVLINCMVFTEGFDAPATAVVANCRPTKSESLYLQVIGRGTRPLAGVVDGKATAEERIAAIEASDKSHCVILDFCGNSGKHKLVSVLDVLGGSRLDPMDVKQAIELAKRSGEVLDMEELAEKAKQARIDRDERKRLERERRLMTNTKADHADYTAVDVELFDGQQFDYQPGAEMASNAQKGVLKLLGISRKKSKHMTKRQASGLISKQVNKVYDQWAGKIQSAANLAQLRYVGECIKRQSDDFFVKRSVDRLRREYVVRQTELRPMDVKF